MRLFSKAIWRTTALRMAFIYLLVIGSAVGIGLYLIYQGTVGVIDRQTRETIEAELGGLSDQYRIGGLARLRRTINNRVASDTRRDEIYLLTRPDATPISGNLNVWPEFAPAMEWFTFPIQRASGDTNPQQAMAMAYELRGGYRLLVGRDMENQVKFKRLFINASFWVALAILGIGLAMGLILSRRILRRVDDAALAGQSVAAGNLDSRLPLAGTGDEFDRLANGFNAMLDRIQGLMSGMRIATDSISHDVRRPLTRLRAKLDLALREPQADRDTTAAMGEALEEVDKTVLILDNLLKIARAEAGVAGETWTQIDIAALTHDAAELYQPLIEDKGIDLTLNLSPFMVEGEPQLLSQAIANLIDNAIKFVPATGGKITISTQEKDAHVCISVADNGPGIAQEDRARATDRFVRLDDGSRATDGSGLGLSLVRAVAQMHYGALELADAGPGLVATICMNRQTKPRTKPRVKPGTKPSLD